ncbi:hypothetical protein L9F63_022633 [Diploptera punctata]|uniref:Uncharacterized protein n=1 Tax=Diploptera punctata TaxID=6984 RepID=A0AAD8EAV4_DIPPU|nr:hypothetical protein L9F63_022633 [Diploptera punctata]
MVMALIPHIFLQILWFVGIILQTAKGEQLLHSVAGEVGRGNYTYYSLMYEGPIVLYLHTSSGDADLYVSQEVARPTYEPDNNDLQSTTCGLDTVFIPSSFKRPVGIGVYGHVSHEKSAYLLEVFYSDEDEDAIFGSYRDYSDDDLENTGGKSFREKSNHPESRYNKDSDVDDEGESFFWTVIWSVFDILLEVVISHGICTKIQKQLEISRKKNEQNKNTTSDLKLPATRQTLQMLD